METLYWLGYTSCRCSRTPCGTLVRRHNRLRGWQLLRSYGSDAPLHNPEVRVRFAPSPTGQLHLGGLRTALYNYLFARSQGGRFILRIEDTDRTRIVAGASEKLMRLLQWSGIEIDEGPGIGGAYGPYNQSERIDLYWQHIQPLLQNGSAYYCFCSSRRLDLLRKAALRRREVPRYDNRCRHLSHEEVEKKLKTNVPYVIRFKLETHTEPWEDIVYGPIVSDVASREGDPVLLKTDRFPTYHFANVVDDHLMEISHVLRGVDWHPSTTKHILLYKAFGWTPPKFAHLPLLLNTDGTKLSKRQNDIQVKHFKDCGYKADALLNLLTTAGSGFKQQDTAGMNMADLIKQFDLSLVKSNSTRLDLGRINELNRYHLQKDLDTKARDFVIDRVTRKAEKRLSEKYPDSSEWRHLLEEEYINRVLHYCQSRISVLDDLFSDQMSFLWFVPDSRATGAGAAALSSKEEALAFLSETHTSLEALDDDHFDTKRVAETLKTVTECLKVPRKAYMVTVRYALSGRKEGPAVAEMIVILGKKATLERLELCRQALWVMAASKE